MGRVIGIYGHCIYGHCKPIQLYTCNECHIYLRHKSLVVVLWLEMNVLATQPDPLCRNKTKHANF